MIIKNMCSQERLVFQMIYHSKSVNDTEALGSLLATHTKAGDVIGFTGDLGAGKTAFTRGLAKGLGCSHPVTSPTFTIVQEYLDGPLPLFHFDLYRLSGEEDLFDLGFEEYFYRNGVCVLEWSERITEFLQDIEGRLLWVSLTCGDEENQRLVEISDTIPMLDFISPN